MLDELRRRIDALDDQILSLLEERARLALEVGKAKAARGEAPFYDPAREHQVFDRLSAATNGPLSTAAVRAIFREIISACLSLQKPVEIAVLGPAGTFTSVAARKLFGDAAHFQERSTIEEVFDAVARGSASRAVSPLENSTEGLVGPAFRALVEHNLLIERELRLDIEHCLFSRESSLANVTQVSSHPQALAQCGRWLATNLPDARLVPSTSTAAALQQATHEAGTAAIGPRQTGEAAALKLLAEKIQDLAFNQTRFVVLSHRDAAPTGQDQTLLGFSLRDGAGALRRALGCFEAEGVNVARLSSHPARDRPWEVFFFSELDGHRLDANLARAIDALSQMAERVKLFGSFPRAN